MEQAERKNKGRTLFAIEKLLRIPETLTAAIPGNLATLKEAAKACPHRG